jgi:sulfate adenylyltransferase subunit 2
VWHYIDAERIPVVPLYFARERDVVIRGDSLIVPEQTFVPRLPGDRQERVVCRMRSLGCSPCTGAIRSSATTVREIIEELVSVRQSERQLRVIDHDQDGSMEMKKREGYF